jgi:hypothetical protein
MKKFKSLGVIFFWISGGQTYDIFDKIQNLKFHYGIESGFPLSKFIIYLQ